MAELELRLVVTQAELDECLRARRAVFIEEQGVPSDEEYDEHDGDPARATGTVHVLGRLDGRPVATGRPSRRHRERTSTSAVWRCCGSCAGGATAWR